MASIRLAASIFALFVASRASAAITVNITAPMANAIVGDSLQVAATISSPFQLASVTAQVGATVGPLTANLSATGTLDISGEPTGASTLTVTATDTQGNSGSAQVVFKRDHSPVLSVTAPLLGTVARPSVRVAATCTDPDAYGCSAITVHVDSTSGTVIASTAGATLDQDVALDAYLGRQINLYIVTTDTAGLTAASTAIAVYVDTSPRLVEVESGLAPIADVDATRILYGTTIHARGTNNDVTLPIELGTRCKLSIGGAICEGGEWKGGAVAATWPLAYQAGGTVVETLAVRDGYGAWAAVDPAGGNAAYYRDSAAGTTTKIANTGPSFAYAQDVAANGDATYVLSNMFNGYPVYLYSGGVLSLIAGSAATNAKYRNALTDGVNVIYQRWYIGWYGGVYLRTGGGTLTLSPDTSCNANFNITYAVRNGWTAYGTPGDICGAVQVWTRAPDDARAQLSVWSTDSTVEALNDSGEVMLFNNSALGNYRYRASAGVFPEVVSSTLGRAVWVGGQWYVVMGRTLFSIAPPSTVDGGAGDLSSPIDLSIPPDLGIPSDLSVAGVDLSTTRQDLAVSPADLNLADASEPWRDQGSSGCTMASRRHAAHGGCVIVLGWLVLFFARARRRTRTRAHVA